MQSSADNWTAGDALHTSLKDGELLLPLTDLADLFRAPATSPLSASPADVLGVSGVEYLLKLLHMDKERQRARRLVIQLPAPQAAAAQAEETANALRRHLECRIAGERHELRNTYRYGARVTAIALVVLAICLAMSSVFTSKATESMRPLIRQTFEYGFEIVGWVTLWHPIETLVFTPLAIRYKIRAMRSLAAMQVVIRADEPTKA